MEEVKIIYDRNTDSAQIHCICGNVFEGLRVSTLFENFLGGDSIDINCFECKFYFSLININPKTNLILPDKK